MNRNACTEVSYSDEYRPRKLPSVPYRIFTIFCAVVVTYCNKSLDISKKTILNGLACNSPVSLQNAIGNNLQNHCDATKNFGNPKQKIWNVLDTVGRYINGDSRYIRKKPILQL